MTRLVAEHRERHGKVRVRLLNAMGLRAQESPARARKPVSTVDERASNGRREVTNFLPLHEQTECAVWKRIGASRITDLVHPAYAAGMPRLSCRFCVLAPKAALVTSARLNPDLAEEYARVERSVDHRFRMDCSMAEVIELAGSDAPVGPVGTWSG
jgi:3'-phosphoadenosine 5'-phosphosulfate sulfotransferase (PAPS reductase)/FAD synthetase